VPMISLIIPAGNKLQMLKRCVESILKKTIYSNYEIILIGDSSDDPAIFRYFKEIEAETKVRVIHDERPFNYPGLNNTAVKFARGELVALVNKDLEVISPEWLSEMVSHALRPGVGAVGARLWSPADTLQHGGVVLGVGGVAAHAHKHLPRYQYGYFGRASLVQNFSAVAASCLVIRKSVYEKVGGFNELDLQVAFYDVDFCLRVREAGYSNVWTPYAELYKHESITGGSDDNHEKKERFAKEALYIKQRWGNQLLNDPAYSPNLTLDHQDFSLAWPPRVSSI
jgi:GT2 family glycosyltransferase